MNARAREIVARNSARITIEGSDLPDVWVAYDTERGVWILANPYFYVRGRHHIIVRAGFEFDLASVPRPAWWAIAPFELSLSAALVHDRLYRYQGAMLNEVYSRQDADLLFNSMMAEERVSTWRRSVAYSAVRVGGVSAWNKATFTDQL